MTFFNQARQLRQPAAQPRPTLREMLAVARQRRALARLDDRALDDVGLTRAQARIEARRPPWDISSYFRG